MRIGYWLWAVGRGLSPVSPSAQRESRSEAKDRGQYEARFFAYFLVAGSPAARQESGSAAGPKPGLENNHPAGSKTDPRTRKTQSTVTFASRITLPTSPSRQQ